MVAPADTDVLDPAPEARWEDLRWRIMRAKVVLYCVCTAIAGVLIGNARVLPFLLGACLLYGGVLAWLATGRARAVVASQRDPASGELAFVRLRLKPTDVVRFKARRRG